MTGTINRHTPRGNGTHRPRTPATGPDVRSVSVVPRRPPGNPTPRAGTRPLAIRVTRGRTAGPVHAPWCARARPARTPPEIRSAPVGAAPYTGPSERH
ncbi:hypothetical protein GCM10012285_30810 [Streptomyces kronopolitis]|uniref:Uncharacterized protein n=1 Tax=Streptomyces kronopolitis TaxID=1612435 RepID=A0ABQ2JJD9_9ACTN|nr:hypothetical protein GCM10012285_30810 [Streptomyces kronopolitis]